MNGLDEMIEAYEAAARWTNDDMTGDLSPDASARVARDCYAFALRAEMAGLWDAESPEQMGHNLWLTRNGHGAGFWDRGLGARGDALTTLAHEMGQQTLETGDDGLVYVL